MLDYLSTNMEDILVVAAAAHGLALAIVNLTPTPVDNTVVASVYRAIELMAGIFTNKAKN